MRVDDTMILEMSLDLTYWEGRAIKAEERVRELDGIITELQDQVKRITRPENER